MIDPNNVSYVDLDDGDEEEYRVKEVATGAGKRRAQQPQTEWGDDIQVGTVNFKPGSAYSRQNTAGFSQSSICISPKYGNLGPP